MECCLGWVSMEVVSKGATRAVRVTNEWDRLHGAFIGIVDEENCVCPTYVEVLKWHDSEGMRECEEFGGTRAIDTTPESVLALGRQLDHLANLPADRGIEVRRSIPLRYPEEIHFLGEVQKGCVNHDGCDFFLTVGNMDGFDVYVDCSGNAGSPAGIRWLQQFSGPQYRAHTVLLHPKILTVCMLYRPGLLIWYPEFVPELPDGLRDWDKIEVRKLPGEDEALEPTA